MNRRQFLAASSATAVAGCAGASEMIKRNPVIAKTSVQLATYEFIKYNPKHAPRVVELARTIQNFVDNEQPVELGMVVAFARSLIRYESLDPIETIAVNNLIDALAVETEFFMEKKGLDPMSLTPNARFVVSTVTQWIGDTGNLFVA